MPDKKYKKYKKYKQKYLQVKNMVRSGKLGHFVGGGAMPDWWVRLSQHATTGSLNRRRLDEYKENVEKLAATTREYNHYLDTWQTANPTPEMDATIEN